MFKFADILDLLEGCQPVSLFVDKFSVYIGKEKYYLPFTRNRLTKKQVYLSLESSIPIRDIAHLVWTYLHQLYLSFSFLAKFIIQTISGGRGWCCVLWGGFWLPLALTVVFLTRSWLWMYKKV